ncbi:hypothetical protein KSP40_PGU012772 [Platanthera guangdongensis]|uniref:Uncharacterized protein n=1 Tax=Platanthera guangdongensis TaxID=2320717 RepID=A0ABR2LTJ0_9ASPA
MAFGGGGFAISYPLAKILSRVMDSCLMRYGHLLGATLGKSSTAYSPPPESTAASPLLLPPQTVCYDRNNFRTVSVSWGFSVQVFEGNRLLTDLLASQKTFRPWKRGRNSTSGIYMFNTREFPRDPCKRPAIFFLERLFPFMNRIVSIYGRDVSGNCPGIPISTRRLQQITVNSEKYYLKIRKVRFIENN